jgi:undecaprenyl pyrophosphate phosphatase UppP
MRSRSGPLGAITARWMTFENRAWQLFMQAERRIRGVPANVRLAPSPFDRQVFRVLVGTCTALVIVLLMPSRVWRIRALLLVGVTMAVLLGVFLLLDAFPRDRR